MLEQTTLLSPAVFQHEHADYSEEEEGESTKGKVEHEIESGGVLAESC
ncbi:MAG: hypothetical protein P4M11_13625 [Candidatus Pacebacteria bacterium]|nr:hypothetical protein [Candidatus Paceibacterota bacterium]